MKYFPPHTTVDYQRKHLSQLKQQQLIV